MGTPSLPLRNRAICRVGRLAWAGLLAGACAVSACSTPVFQYALENWSPDVYDVLVTANGVPEAELMAQAEAVSRPTVRGAVNAGVRFRQDLAVTAGTAVLDVRLPNQPPGASALCSGPWSQEALRQVIDSPLRERVADELRQRAAAVFLFLPAGEAAADTAARARLQATLDEFSRSMVLPALDPDDPAALPESAPRALRFAVLDVPRDDPAEAFLQRLLLATEPDLATLREPMAFPVFGRGRVLYAIVGAGINRDILAETCGFLTGACSCQVKSQNPGVDLLLRADWDQIAGLEPAGVTELPPLTLVDLPDLEAAPAAPALAVPAPASASAARSLPSHRRLVWVAALAAVVVVAGSLVLLRRAPAD